MTRIRIKGFKIYRDRHGKMRCYHRLTGIPIDLEKYPFGSVEFAAECIKIAKEKISSDTLGNLWEEFKNSPSFINLKSNTQMFYSRPMKYLGPIMGENIDSFDRPLIIMIRDKAFNSKGWHFANALVTTLSSLFSWGVERGKLSNNPAAEIKKIPRPKDKPRANRPWTDEERFAVLDAIPLQLKTVLGTIMYTGMDPIDAINLHDEQFDGVGIGYERAKTGKATWKPVPSELSKILDQRMRGKFLCLNSDGKQWTKDGLDSSWQRWKLKLETEGKIGKGLTLKGLRHTKATILREMGVDKGSIAKVLAQDTEGMASWYSRDANMDRQMTAVTTQFDIEEKRRRLSNRGKKLSNRKSAKRTTV